MSSRASSPLRTSSPPGFRFSNISHLAWGKTTTKEMISAVLGARLRVYKTPGNFNNDLQVVGALHDLLAQRGVIHPHSGGGLGDQAAGGHARQGVHLQAPGPALPVQDEVRVPLRPAAGEAAA